MTSVQLRCAEAFRALGPKPPWWRPLRRRRWLRVAGVIVDAAIADVIRGAFRGVVASVPARPPARPTDAGMVN